MWKCGKLNKKPPNRMRFGGDEKRVIDITDEHINY